jgi:hypothetical protein
MNPKLAPSGSLRYIGARRALGAPGYHHQSATYKNLDQARRNVNWPTLLKYGGESGCDKVLIIDDENVWNWVGRHISPLSSNFP